MADPEEHARAGVRMEVRHIMDRVSSIGTATAAACGAGGAVERARRGAAPAGDRLELSGAAREPDAAAEAELRERIAEIRRRIATGTYLTPEKLDVVAEELRAEIFGR